jgi:translocator protein
VSVADEAFDDRPREATLQRSRVTQALGLVGWLALVFSVAGIGAAASGNAGTFYAQLSRPGWAPPASAFGPVWSVLYLLMGIAVWLVWRNRGAARLRLALGLFLLQLCANALWSWLFFAWRSGPFAFTDVLLLLALIAATIAVFWRISRLAAILMVPYLAWVTLAAALTWSVWQRNPAALQATEDREAWMTPSVRAMQATGTTKLRRGVSG